MAQHPSARIQQKSILVEKFEVCCLNFQPPWLVLEQHFKDWLLIRPSDSRKTFFANTALHCDIHIYEGRFTVPLLNPFVWNFQCFVEITLVSCYSHTEAASWNLQLNSRWSIIHLLRQNTSATPCWANIRF